MTDHDALLAAIADQPDEDTPRLMFADRLQDQGGNVNTAWGFFIRGQIQLAREPVTANEAVARRVRLLDTEFWHQKWLEQLGVWAPDTIAWQTWERGFPTGLRGSFDAVRALRARSGGRLPVPARGLSLTAATADDLQDLTTWPEVRWLHRLEVYRGFGRDVIPPPGLVALARSELLGGLEQLSLWGVSLSDAAVEAILASPHLARLRSVAVRWDRRPGETVSEHLQERFTARFGEAAIRIG